MRSLRTRLASGWTCDDVIPKPARRRVRHTLPLYCYRYLYCHCYCHLRSGSAKPRPRISPSISMCSRMRLEQPLLSLGKGLQNCARREVDRRPWCPITKGPRPCSKRLPHLASHRHPSSITRALLLHPCLAMSPSEQPKQTSTTYQSTWRNHDWISRRCSQTGHDVRGVPKTLTPTPRTQAGLSAQQLLPRLAKRAGRIHDVDIAGNGKAYKPLTFFLTITSHHHQPIPHSSLHI